MCESHAECTRLDRSAAEMEKICRNADISYCNAAIVVISDTYSLNVNCHLYPEKMVMGMEMNLCGGMGVICVYSCEL